MNNIPREKLCEIIAQFGQDLCDDPKRVEGLLRDLCGEHAQEIFALVSAQKQRVATDLLTSHSGTPINVVLAQLTDRLQQKLGLKEDLARWAVESWALALGKISPAQITRFPVRPSLVPPAGPVVSPPAPPSVTVPPVRTPLPRITRRGSRVLFPITLLITALLLASAGFYLTGYLETLDNAQGNTMRIEKDTSFLSFCKLLEERKIVKVGELFYYGTHWLENDPKLKSGEFYIKPKLALSDFAAYVETMQPNLKQITIAEGATAEQVLSNFHHAGLGIPDTVFRHLMNDQALIQKLELNFFGAANLQGFLLPGAYEIATNWETTEILEILVKQFLMSWRQNKCDSLYDELSKSYLSQNSNLSNLTKYDLIILASMVNDWVKADRVAIMPSVARIFYNRMARRLTLPLRSQNVGANSHTTPQIGLPKIPLNNPSLSAIKAVLQPAQHNYLNLIEIGIH